jgi:hypothetical protein
VSELINVGYVVYSFECGEKLRDALALLLSAAPLLSFAPRSMAFCLAFSRIDVEAGESSFDLIIGEILQVNLATGRGGSGLCGSVGVWVPFAFACFFSISILLDS